MVAGWVGDPHNKEPDKSTVDKNIDIENPSQLRSYLNYHGLSKPGDQLRFKTLHGGVSNRTVLIQRDHGTDWVFKQALEKLRVKTDWYSSVERIHQEALALKWLMKIIPKNVPSLVFEDKTNHIMGMTAVAKPHSNWKEDLMTGKVDLDLVSQFGQLLAKVHSAIDQFNSLKTDFHEYSFFESLRLEPYYAYTATQVPEAKAFLNHLIDETKVRRTALVHGDYSPKNVLVHNGKVYILDYEVMHYGDPAFDLGFSLTHFLSKAHALPEFRDQFFKAANYYWVSYLEALKPSDSIETLEAMTIKHTLACMLARVAGRSPLEYLDKPQRTRQREMALEIIKDPPKSFSNLIDLMNQFLKSNK